MQPLQLLSTCHSHPCWHEQALCRHCSTAVQVMLGCVCCCCCVATTNLPMALSAQASLCTLCVCSPLPSCCILPCYTVVSLLCPNKTTNLQGPQAHHKRQPPTPPPAQLQPNSKTTFTAASGPTSTQQHTSTCSSNTQPPVSSVIMSVASQAVRRVAVSATAPRLVDQPLTL